MRLLALQSSGTDGTDANRCLNDVDRLGWGYQCENALRVLPFVDGFIQVNPGGVLHGEQMQLTQFAQARRAGLTWIYEDFIERWKPVCDAYRAAGKEPIAYIGSYKDDKLWHQTPADAKVSLFKESFRHLADSGFTFALDTFHQIPRELLSDAVAMLKRLKVYSKKTRVYVEPYPAPMDTWANELQSDVFKIGAMLQNFNAAFKWQSSRLTDSLPDFRGEVIVHITDDKDINGVKRGWDDQRWILDDLRKCGSLGWSAAVPHDCKLPWGVMRSALNGAVTT